MRPLVELVLLEKIYGPYRPEDFTPALLTLCSGLEVDVRVVGTAGRGWLVVEVSGEDEEVAVRLVEEEMGLAPVEPGRLSRYDEVRGRILSLADDGLVVDIGVFRPLNLDALVPLGALRAQLADGLGLSMAELSSLFCLSAGLPFEVELSEDPSPPGPVEAGPSEGQVRELEEWVSSGLDRLVITGASHHAVKKAVGGSGLHKHVLAVERLGALENCVILKLGAPVGKLFGVLRRRLPWANIMVFRPGRVLDVLPGRFGRLFLTWGRP